VKVAVAFLHVIVVVVTVVTNHPPPLKSLASLSFASRRLRRRVFAFG